MDGLVDSVVDKTAGSNRFPAATPVLLDGLRSLQASNPKAVRSNVHVYPGSIYAPGDVNARDRYITSWKMTEHMYFNKDNGFPTLARGLFTEQVSGSDQIPPAAIPSYEGGPIEERIVARGYDKFFNTGEMAWTNWAAMEKYTAPPYHLTLKSNGCLILISALSPTHLVVASKHSLGTTTTSATTDSVANSLEAVTLSDKGNGNSNDAPSPADKEESEAVTHAAMGRIWVTRSLKKAQKSPQELAKRLWDNNLTAVLELCDDSFEEHVIATPDKWTGLHLHGLNSNTPHFATRSPDEVAAFAREFGFIVTKHEVLQSLAEVRQFTDKIAESGSWQGDMIEGFVVRARVQQCSEIDDGCPPYPPGSPFFFKVKFDEPYMLYRQWREITRMLIGLLPPGSDSKEEDVWKKVRPRIKRPEVGVYAEWALREIRRNPTLFDNYERGVVRVREAFLVWTQGDGESKWDAAKSGTWRPEAALTAEKTRAERDAELASLPKKYILMPVAVPGCGKTMMGVALNKLFGIAHTQSDDVLAKNTAPTFKKNIADLFKSNDIVYADRNNHIEKHFRELSGLRDEKQVSRALRPFDIRVIGIVWDVESHPYHRVLRLCSERVVNRGENHQTLRPDPTMEAEHEAVVASFLHRYTSPDPAILDAQITIDIEDGPRVALGKIVDGLVQALKLPRPSEADIDAALASATDYKTLTPFHGLARVGKDVRYFGLAPEIDLNAVINDALRSPMPETSLSSARTFVEALRNKDRVTQRPHITLSHNKNVAAEKDAASAGTPPGPHEIAWNTCKSLVESRFSPPYEFDITHVVWDDRVMALVCANLRPVVDPVRGAGPNLELPSEVKENLHITVGTQSEDISAFESRGIIRRYREASADGGASGEAGEAVEGGGAVHWAAVQLVTGAGRLRGMY